MGVELWRATIIIPYVSADHILLLGGGDAQPEKGLSWRSSKSGAEIRRPTEGGGNARAISEGVLCLKFDRLTEWLVGGLKV